MANVYNSRAYLQNLTRSNTVTYDPVCVTARTSGEVYRQEISISLPTGLSNVAPDVIYLLSHPGSAFSGAAGIQVKRLYLVSTGDVGGTTTFNLGWRLTNATAYGSALTNLQGTTALDVAIATLLAQAQVTQADDLVMTIASAGPSTTARTVTGFVDYSFNRPV